MNRKKSILFVNGHLKTGGVEMALINLLNSLDYSKYDVDLLLLQGGYDYEAELPKEVTLHKVDLDPSQGRFGKAIIRNIRRRDYLCISYRVLGIIARKLSKRVFKWLNLGNGVRKKYDAAISFRPGICADIILYNIKAKKKICWWHHGDTDIGISIDSLGAQLGKFDKVVAVSQGVKDMLGEKFNDLEAKLCVIPNIVDQKQIIAKSREYTPYISNRERDERVRIVTVSRLSSEKNVGATVDVAKRLFDDEFKFEWHIIGDGDCFQEIKQKILDYGLENHIYLEGNQVNPYPWIKGADLMVHPSPVESFGIVILEAMALSVPCIAVESIGAKELINGKNGILTANKTDFIFKAVKDFHKSDKSKNVIRYQKETVNQYSTQNIHKMFDALIYD